MSLKKLELRPGTMDQFIQEEMESDPYRVKSILPQCRIIVDAGANIGAFARFVLEKEPTARVVCIEAEPDNFYICRKNLSGFVNCTVVHAALLAKSGNVCLNKFGSENSACHTVLELSDSDTSRVTVPGICLPQLMDDQGIGHVDLLKLDIQGGEFDLIDAWPSSLLKQIDYISLEIHPFILHGDRRLGSIPNAKQRIGRLTAKLKRTHVAVYGDASDEHLSVMQWRRRSDLDLFSRCLLKLRDFGLVVSQKTRIGRLLPTEMKIRVRAWLERPRG